MVKGRRVKGEGRKGLRVKTRVASHASRTVLALKPRVATADLGYRLRPPWETYPCCCHSRPPCVKMEFVHACLSPILFRLFVFPLVSISGQHYVCVYLHECCTRVPPGDAVVHVAYTALQVDEIRLHLRVHPTAARAPHYIL